MITNSALTIYHMNGLDVATHNEKWVRYNYNKVWFFGGKGASINKGYDNANDVEIRIPYDENNNLNVNNFAVGDIIIKGNINLNIETQDDLQDYEIYNIISIKNNDYGNNQHIHIGGR